MKIEDVIKSTKPIELHNKTVINIMYTARYIEQFATHFKAADMSMPQYNVLRILRGQQGKPANLSTIQDRMIDKNSNTTRLVDKLLKRGLVKRQICKQNRRKVEIFITEEGLKQLATLDPIIEEYNQNATKNLNHKELELLNHLLDKLRNNE